ncbi:MAG TPA: hypothetical protein VG815_14675 [Chloroflexota bacterium]|nr:hypothetical protein [Chloroflexota bacterium]
MRAVASWQAEVPFGDVQQVVGMLSPAVIDELLAKIAAILRAPKATPDARPGAPGD